MLILPLIEAPEESSPLSSPYSVLCWVLPVMCDCCHREPWGTVPVGKAFLVQRLKVS